MFSLFQIGNLIFLIILAEKELKKIASKEKKELKLPHNWKLEKRIRQKGASKGKIDKVDFLTPFF